jgi:flagellar basal body-associated protein FliL
MSQSILIIVISIIVAIVVGSIVFLVWTFMEKLRGRPATGETAEVTENGEQEQAESNAEEDQEG